MAWIIMIAEKHHVPIGTDKGIKSVTCERSPLSWTWHCTLAGKSSEDHAVATRLRFVGVPFVDVSANPRGGIIKTSAKATPSRFLTCKLIENNLLRCTPSK